MANTYTSLHYDIIFSTKNRDPWITPNNQPRIWEYIGGIARKHKMKALRVGGIQDHAHILVAAPPKFAPSTIVQILKGDSSRWIHNEFQNMRRFEWQDGYGAFSVSRTDIPGIIHYIKSQPQHHRMKTFQEEYLQYLQRNSIQYNEKYLWG
jgi:putative transposase